MIRLEKAEGEKPVIKMYQATQSGDDVQNPWHEHTWLLHELILLVQTPKDPWQVICDHFSRDVHLNHGLCEPAKKKASHLLVGPQVTTQYILLNICLIWQKNASLYIFINMGCLKHKD